MKNVKILFICSIFTLMFAGIVVAAIYPKMRTNYDTAYFQKSDGTWCSVKLNCTCFSDQNITTQAALKDQNGNWRLLYASQSTSTPVKYVHP